MMPAVVVREVTKRFRSRVALDGVSLDIGAGVTGLLGPNGAGKTTLLRIIATALGADSGDVRVLGLDPGRDDARLAIRRMLGYLPQDTGLYGGFTGYDFVDYVAILKELTDPDERRDEVRRVLTAVGLSDCMHVRIRALSGGMRRRVALAQTLLGGPRLLVLDEPTVGLDPVQRLRFRETISRVAPRATVLLSTHLTEDVAALCAQVIVIDQGRILFAGRPAELAALAEQKVWQSDRPDPNATLTWVTGDGHHRHIGTPPAGAGLVAARLEDGYLLLATSASAAVAS
jgi:ABC-2 type transport system ATP-binding protein